MKISTTPVHKHSYRRRIGYNYDEKRCLAAWTEDGARIYWRCRDTAIVCNAVTTYIPAKARTKYRRATKPKWIYAEPDTPVLDMQTLPTHGPIGIIRKYPQLEYWPIKTSTVLACAGCQIGR